MGDSTKLNIHPRDEDPHWFIITSSGAAATRWLGGTLHRHPDICCSCGAGDLDITLRYDSQITPEEYIRVAAKLQQQFEGSQSQDQSLDTLFDHLKARKQARFYGNLHRETVLSLSGILRRFPTSRRIALANVIRHPVTRTDSKARIIQTDCRDHPSMAAVYKIQFEDRMQRFATLADTLFDQIGDYTQSSERMGFINALFDTLEGLPEFNTPDISPHICHFKIEDLKTCPNRFREFLECISDGQLTVDEAYLNWVFSDENRNAGRFSTGPSALIPPPEAEAQWVQWGDWKQRAFQSAMRVCGLDEPYRQQGYDFKFIASLPNSSFPGLGERLRPSAPRTKAPALFNQMP